MAAAEEPPDHFGADFARSAGKVLGPEPGGKGYLQASPDIGYVRVLEPDPRCKALQYEGAQLVCKRQVAPQRLPIQPVQVQCDSDWRARYREIQARNLSGEEIVPDADVLAGPACIRGNKDIDQCLRIVRIVALHPGRNIRQPASKTIASHLHLTDALEAADDVLITDHYRRNAEVHVSSLPIQAGTQLPPGGQHRDDVAADDAVFSRDISECSGQIIERHVAEIIGN